MLVSSRILSYPIVRMLCAQLSASSDVKTVESASLQTAANVPLVMVDASARKVTINGFFLSIVWTENKVAVWLIPARKVTINGFFLSIVWTENKVAVWLIVVIPWSISATLLFVVFG